MATYSTDTAVEPSALTALFNNRDDADSAYKWLLKNGYNSSDVHLLRTRDRRRRRGGLGVALGIVAAAGAAVINPGMGLAVAGPLAASLAGAGGLGGGALGALYGSSVPEEEAHELEQKIRRAAF